MDRLHLQLVTSLDALVDEGKEAPPGEPNMVNRKRTAVKWGGFIFRSHMSRIIPSLHHFALHEGKISRKDRPLRG